MDSTGVQRHCPSCQSTNLQYGLVGIFRHTFTPAGQKMMIGYDAWAFVCLDCGTLSHYLDEKALKEIKKSRANNTEQK